MSCKNFFSIFCIIILFPHSLYCQTFKSDEAEKLIKGSKLVRVNPKTRNIQFIQLRNDAKDDEKDHSIWLGKALKISDKHSFKEISRTTDKINFERSKHQLYYKNIPVEGAIYNVHSKSGKIYSANGDYSPGQDVKEIPAITESLAFEAAIKFVNAKKYKWEIERSTRPLGLLAILPVKEKYVLAYKFDIYAIIPLSRQYIFIDANTGYVIKTLNRIHEINTPGTAETFYNGSVRITTDSYSGHFRLRETGRGNGIETYDMNKGINTSNAIDFTDDDNNWNTTTDFDNAAYDAHYATEFIYDYYYQKFDLNSYDGLGTKLKNYVHYSEGYLNAFWDGNSLYYGDGDNVSNFPFTPVEIVAHELTHAVTEKSAGLVYEYESGALNESFSDIFSITIDFYEDPKANYQIGDAVTATHRPFRDLSNPNACGNPDTYKGLYWDQKQEVHCNSGVQNFWYYLLCEGGTGKNDNGDTFNVNGIGREKASQIAFRNLSVYLAPNSDYADARFYSIQSAKDLFGDCSADVTAVAAAWHAVGIGDANDCLSPENFTATQTGSSRITLNWKKNINNNDILLAYSLSKNLGNPVNGTIYSPGSEIPGGGVIIYSGSASSFEHTGLKPKTKYYYKAWSLKPDKSYSGGVTATVIPPGIDAGEDQKIVLPLKSEVMVSGTYPEGLLYDSLIFKWEKKDGEGSVAFDDPSSLSTVVRFNEPGKYTLQFSMGYYGLLSTDTMHVVVSLTDSITNYIFPGYHNWMGLEIQDKTAFLANLKFGLRIMDISDPTRPIEISGYDKFNVKFVHVEGDYAYISQNFGGGLTILNIKDKYKPLFAGYFDVPDSNQNEDFIVKNGIVYFTSIPDGLIIIDATNPADPVRIGGFPCTPLTISLIENYLYVTERASKGITPFLLDISDPRNPRKIKEFPKIYAEFIAPDAIQGEYLFRCQQNADTNFYFCVYDISDRLNPKLAGSTEISWNNCSISVQGNYAYLNDGLRVIDISDKSHPVEVSSEYAESFDQVSAIRNIIYCTRGEAFVIYKSWLDNRAPYVYAGIDRNIDSVSIILHGEVFDEGLPEGADVSYSWSKTSGPGNISFSDIHSLNSAVSFSDTGRYVIRLSASDGEMSGFDEISCYVPFAISKQPVNQSSCVNARVEFSVEVKSKTAVSFKWYKDGIPLTDLPNITGTKTERLIIHKAITQDAGNYYCQISNGNNLICDEVKLTVLSLPAAPVSQNISACQGEQVPDLNAEGSNIQWYTDPGLINLAYTGNSFPSGKTQPGVYVYYATQTANECQSPSRAVNLIINALPSRPVITFNNGSLHSDAPSGNQWYYNNQPLQNASNSSFIPLSDGNYTVIVTTNSCSSQPSDVYTWVSTGINDPVAANIINAYPNPATDGVKISISNKFDSDFIVGVYDSYGGLLETLKKSQYETFFEVDLSKYSAGYYIIRVYNTSKHYQVKVIRK